MEEDGSDAPVRINVVEVTGFIDPVVVDFIGDAITSAEEVGATVLVIRLDSEGSVVAPAMLDRLVTRVRHARVPVAVWVGEHRGATARRGAFQLVDAAAMAGAVPGARVGGDADVPVARAERAVAEGVLDVVAPTLGDFIVSLDGRRVDGNTISIPTEVVRTGDAPQRQLASRVRVGFEEPTLMAQLLHAVATPSATYVLFVLALLLITFEFFTAGVGLLGACGAACGVLAAYGLGVLPVEPLGLVLIAVGIFGVAVDLQAGAPRAWTIIGFVAFVAGSLLLYDGMRPSVVTLVLVVLGLLVLAARALPVLIRVRFSTRSIDRGWMVGETGVAATDLDADGSVRVREGAWGARTRGATIAAGTSIRVVGVADSRLDVDVDVDVETAAGDEPR
jgi:membrane-bound serine protease (ClpP class)